VDFHSSVCELSGISGSMMWPLPPLMAHLGSAGRIVALAVHPYFPATVQTLLWGHASEYGLGGSTGNGWCKYASESLFWHWPGPSTATPVGIVTSLNMLFNCSHFCFPSFGGGADRMMAMCLRRTHLGVSSLEPYIGRRVQWMALVMGAYICLLS
jgi:hypothetical protein